MSFFSNLNSAISNILIKSDAKTKQKYKKECTQEEKEEMIKLIEDYSVSYNDQINRPKDFGGILNVGKEMKEIFKKNKINPTCYLKSEKEEVKEASSVKRNEECIQDSECGEGLKCIGYKKDLKKGNCLSVTEDIIDTSKMLIYGSECETQRDCSIGYKCSVKNSLLRSKKQCVAYTFPVKSTDDDKPVKIVLYDIVK